MSTTTLSSAAVQSLSPNAVSAVVGADELAEWTAEDTQQVIAILAHHDAGAIYSDQYREYVVTKALAQMGIDAARPPLTLDLPRKSWFRRGRHHLTWWPPRRRCAVRVAKLAALEPARA